jgi:hypothetical protein
MRGRHERAFVDALAADRRPSSFEADPSDVDVLRVAVTMRAARPGDDVVDPGFVARLHQQLVLQLREPKASASRAISRRARLAMGAAAVATMMGGTVAATTTVEHALVASSAGHANQEQLLRMGTFESVQGRRVGEIVAYRGNPSWVFMSVNDASMSGSLSCMIRLSNGQTAATGSFQVNGGRGEWARTVSFDVSRFRGATLTSPTGTVLATAVFRS